VGAFYSIFISRLGFLSLLLSLVVSPFLQGWAGTFQVNPVQLFLSARTKSALLTVRNESADTLRFQLSVHAWDQSPQGEVILGPTEDVVFFPSLLSLAPGEERRVRVGAVIPIASSEKSYRIFIEELPPLSKPKGSPGETQVRLLTKMGIPIFLQPDQAAVEARIQGMGVQKGVLSFQLKNAGNVHFVPQAIRVKGYGMSGEILFERSLEGWYMLADRHRIYDLNLLDKECAKIKTLGVEVQMGQKTLRDQIEMPPGACS